MAEQNRHSGSGKTDTKKERIDWPKTAVVLSALSVTFGVTAYGLYKAVQFIAQHPVETAVAAGGIGLAVRFLSSAKQKKKEDVRDESHAIPRHHRPQEAPTADTGNIVVLSLRRTPKPKAKDDAGAPHQHL